MTCAYVLFGWSYLWSRSFRISFRTGGSVVRKLPVWLNKCGKDYSNNVEGKSHNIRYLEVVLITYTLRSLTGPIYFTVLAINSQLFCLPYHLVGIFTKHLALNVLCMLPWAIFVTKITLPQSSSWTYYAIIWWGERFWLLWCQPNSHGMDLQITQGKCQCCTSSVIRRSRNRTRKLTI